MYLKIIIFGCLLNIVGFAITYLVLDLITGDLQSLREYIRQTVIVGILVGIGWYLNDNGRNLWQKIGGLFKREETYE